MQELLIDVDNENKKILLVENGKLIEKYEENPGRDRLEGNIFLGIVEYLSSSARHVKNILHNLEVATVPFSNCIYITSSAFERSL